MAIASSAALTAPKWLVFALPTLLDVTQRGETAGMA
jgi:hypothetical protein